MNKTVLWDWRKRAVEQGLNISSWSLKITSCDVILSGTTAAHSARSGQTFYEWGRKKEEQSRICRSAIVEKNSRLTVEEIALAFLRICMSIISDAFHVHVLSSWICEPHPYPVKLKIACVLERPCPWMNLHGFLKSARKLLQVLCVCLSEKTSKQSGPPPFEGLVWVILKNIHPANWFQGEKMLQGNTWQNKFWKIKQPLGTEGGGGTAIYGLYQETMRFSYLIVCAAVKGMVFKQFTLG